MLPKLLFRPAWVIGAFVAAAVLALIAWNAGIIPGGTMTPEEQLLARPTYEQADRDYIAMLDEMKTALSKVSPQLQWRTTSSSQDGDAECDEPFLTIPGANSGYYTSGEAIGGISDSEWPQAIAAIDAIARKHGYTEHTTLSRPGDTSGTKRERAAVWRHTYGGTLHLGTYLGTTLDVFGSCYLNTAHHHRAKALSTPQEPTFDHIANSL